MYIKSTALKLQASFNIMVTLFHTSQRHGYSVEFSPYHAQRIAVATSENFGIAGGGSLFILDALPNGEIVPIRTFNWTNGLFDVTWSENNEEIAICGSGDGTVQLWNINHPTSPVQVWNEHQKEVYGVNWSPVRGENYVLSASWDQTVKLWDISRGKCLATYRGHDHVVYTAVWAPLVSACFASVSGDKTLRVWDARKQYMPQMVIPAHNSEIIACDWCKYNQNLVVTGGVDGAIKGWDLRNYKQPVFELKGHQYAIRRLKCSPFQGTILATCSYDFSTRFWDIRQPSPMEVIEHHSEFVCGLSFNIHIPGQVADCSWDQTVKVYSPASLSPQQPLPPMSAP